MANKSIKQREAERLLQSRTRDLSMMQTPECWPMWPFLPLKKYEAGQMISGVLVSTDLVGDAVVQPIIYSHYIHGAKCFNPKNILASYKDLADLMNDGWVVD